MALRDRLEGLAAPVGGAARRIKLGKLGPLNEVPHTARVLFEAGVLKPIRPDHLVLALRELQRWGTSPAAGVASASIGRPNEVALTDEAGELTWMELHKRSNALANALAERGIGPGDGIAIMARNHRGFIDATIASSKLGANALYMNTAFAGPQLADVVERERPSALIYDDEFTGLLSEAMRAPGGKELTRVVAWEETGERSDPSMEDLIHEGDEESPTPPPEPGRSIILTSGTTGTPKGAQRSQPDTLGPLASLLSRIPLRSEETTMIAAPLFHSWGFAHFQLGLALRSSYVVRRRFDPEDTLAAIADSGATALVVVPVMMQRILELPRETIEKYDVGSLRVTAASGSALPGPLATKWMDRFGDNLYNLYGSTEVAWATIATPDDLRAAPGTAGIPPRGTMIKIVDENGSEVRQGNTGRIFVGNEMAFEGYTGGGGKETIDGLLSSGDVGHFDSGGRLHIDGRDDEMIVSGGENVFPREIEDLIAGHDDVEEVAVIGVDDDEFGQRLKAFVVVRGGADLDDDSVKAFVRSNLARYKVPREVEFLDSLPRNATGKVLKRELA